MDAFELLMNDHRKVSEIFDRLESGDSGLRREMFPRLKQELDVHAHVEETIFYPALKENEETRELIAEAYDEHAAVKDLLAEMETMSPEDGGWDELLAELREAPKRGEALRQQVLHKLAASGAPGSWAAMVREVVELDQASATRMFGDALPPGLKLLR